LLKAEISPESFYENTCHFCHKHTKGHLVEFYVHSEEEWEMTNKEARSLAGRFFVCKHDLETLKRDPIYSIVPEVVETKT
jgi:hypothetical protein